MQAGQVGLCSPWPGILTSIFSTASVGTSTWGAIHTCGYNVYGPTGWVPIRIANLKQIMYCIWKADSHIKYRKTIRKYSKHFNPFPPGVTLTRHNIYLLVMGTMKWRSLQVRKEHRINTGFYFILVFSSASSRHFWPRSLQQGNNLGFSIIMPNTENKKEKSLHAKNLSHFCAYGHCRSLQAEGMKFPQVPIFRIKVFF